MTCPKLCAIILPILLALAIASLTTQIIPLEHHNNIINNAKNLELGCVDYVFIVILVDNDCNPTKPYLQCPWGLSVYIKTPTTSLIFDTGPDPTALVNNAKYLGVDLSKIDAIVISHEHGDHVGGISAITKLNNKVPIYVPKGMDPCTIKWLKTLDPNIVVVKEPKVLDKGILILGPLYGPPYEQALVINVCGFGPILITGCGHPGVTKFVALAKEILGTNVTLVLGGFHLLGYPRTYVDNIVKTLLNEGVKFIAPIHCSGSTIRELLKNRYPHNYIELYVGSQLYLDP